MIHYYSLAAILSLFAFMEVLANSKFIRPILILYGFFLLFLFAGLRGYDFSDYNNYVAIFDQVYIPDNPLDYGSYPAGIHSEILYLLLNVFIKSFTDNATYVFVIVALLAVGINLYCFKKYSPYVLVSVFLYFSHVYLYKELIQIRAGLAGALILFSVTYIQRRDVLRFITVILMTTFIHTGAIVALPVYWLCKIRLTKKVMCLPLLIGVILAQVGWLDGFLGFLENIGSLPQGVKIYMGAETLDYSLGIFNPTTLKQIIIYLIAIYYKDSLSARLPYFYPLLVMYVLSTAWILAFNDFAILASRIATFLSVGEAVIIPSLALLFKEKRTVLIMMILFAWVMLYLNIEIKQMWPPYQSVLLQ